MNRTAFRVLAFTCLAGLVAVSGCGSGVGPLTPVEGKVLVGGQPLTVGEVKFWPEEANGVSLNIAGKIGPDGTYKMTTNGNPGVPKGKYKVTVLAVAPPASQTADPGKMSATPPPAAPPQRLANIKYENAATTDLSIEVPSASYDLTLTR